jgi:hypothetical protein
LKLIEIRDARARGGWRQAFGLAAGQGLKSTKAGKDNSASETAFWKNTWKRDSKDIAKR